MTPRSMDKTASRVSDRRLAELLDEQKTTAGAMLAHPGFLQQKANEWFSILTELQTLRPLSSDSVSDGSKGVRLDGPELWEIVFGIMKGDVPEELTEDVLSQVAAAVNQSFALDSGTGGQQPVAMEPERVRKLKSIYDKMANEGGGTWATYMLMDIEEFVAMSVSSPTDPKAGVVSEDMVERIKAILEADKYAEEDIEGVEARDAYNRCITRQINRLTAALNGDKP